MVPFVRRAKVVGVIKLTGENHYTFDLRAVNRNKRNALREVRFGDPLTCLIHLRPVLMRVILAR